MEFLNKLNEVLNEGEISIAGGWLLLKRPETPSKDHFKQLLATKPGEINIIVDRVADIIKNGKAQREVIIEILKVLSRSYVARQFVGYGLTEEYKLFKGFPVRRGDSNDNMPEPGTELNLEPKDTFLSWTTEASAARKSAATYDNTTGEPIGGLMVKLTTDSSKILFDINAVLKAVVDNYKVIEEYNTSAASGMAISKKNTEYLAREAKRYFGDYEVTLSANLNKCVVEDKWTWSGEGDTKKIAWMESNKKEEDTDDEDETPTIQKEQIYALTESVNSEALLDEGVGRFVRNLAATTFGTERGKMMSYLAALLDQYRIQQDIMEASLEFVQAADEDDARVKMAEAELDRIHELISDTENTLNALKNDTNLRINISKVD